MENRPFAGCREGLQAERRILGRRFTQGAVLAVLGLVGACDNDTGTNLQDQEAMFEVRIENVSGAFDYTSTGVFNTPSGSDNPGPLFPGNSYEFGFDAGPGSSVSFATMFVQSNDLFFAPGGIGIPVFDAMGAPLSGDITDQIYLWDAGTEANQEPGLGLDQAPRQGGANMGAADPNTAVRMAEDVFGNLPEVNASIRVTLSHLGGTEFRIRIANIAADDALQTSDGGMAPVLLAPGVWTVGSGTDALFSVGQPDPGLGLEDLAEDGSVAGYNVELAARTGLASPIAPGVYAAHAGASALFMAGAADGGEGMEALAEDGDPSGLFSVVAAKAGVTDSGVFNTPDGAAGPAPAFPGDSYVFTVRAMPGDRLSFATMFVQSNDLFYAPAEAGVALFDTSGNPKSGDITGMVLLWDAGTEVNEAPGLGPNQAPRQSGANSGTLENGTVRQVNDEYGYPDVDQIIRVTLTPINSGF